MFPIEFCIGVSRSANETLNSWYYGRRLFRDCVCPTALAASRRIRTIRLILIRLTAYREALYSYYFAHTDFPWLYNIMVGLWVLVKGNNANNEWHLFICFSFYFIFILFFRAIYVIVRFETIDLKDLFFLIAVSFANRLYKRNEDLFRVNY